jgi:NAD-dependent dihydropyrimidine dehydrogenase PreA subunit
MVGFCCPTLVSRPSCAMEDFVRGLRGLRGVPVFTIVTYSTAIGDGSNRLRRLIARLGGLDAGAHKLACRNLFPGYVSRGYLFRPTEPGEAALASIPPFLAKTAARALEGGPYGTDPRDPRPKAVFRFERLALNRALVRGLYSRFIRFDPAACLGCQACMAACPRGNIAQDKRGRKRAGRDCLLCLNCEISCPAGAVRSPIHWPIFGPFLAYNIRQALADGIPHAPSPRSRN